MTRRVVVEADGGSRGNPGPAAFGALVRDVETGAVLATCGETIGTASNNVAEYQGLIAGLELVAEHAPGADVEVRMDSKLVVEQMAGRWRIKHDDMVRLAARARELSENVVQWTWVPRAENAAADALANEALDEQARTGRQAVVGTAAPAAPHPAPEADDLLAEAPASAEQGTNAGPDREGLGWRGRMHGDPTTLVLLRHGVTDHTVRKLFCGSGGSDPGLNPEGEAQAVRAAAWIDRTLDVDAIIASPLRRTRETAGFVARELGLEVDVEPGVAETAFGAWDGHSFAEIMAGWPDELEAWLGSTAVAPPGGETFDAVYERAVQARGRILHDHPGRTVVVVSHVTPIKMLVREALGAPMSVIHAMELAPASITTIAWWPDATPSLKNFSVVPE
ncbi:bifunctional RNase H/acid phosphatase [Aeromicrobium sp. CF4.19]|uniref:bifunctional RNase H/acid phosphatase n=1 Tax=Aeromicrobium sp. CF4.19 TaxID=3373082 RepID=UPI003EE6ACC7